MRLEITSMIQIEVSNNDSPYSSYPAVIAFNLKLLISAIEIDLSSYFLEITYIVQDLHLKNQIYQWLKFDASGLTFVNFEHAIAGWVSALMLLSYFLLLLILL